MERYWCLRVVFAPKATLWQCLATHSRTACARTGAAKLVLVDYIKGAGRFGAPLLVKEPYA